MKYLKQFLIIIGFSFAGEALHVLLPLPVPASIYGIILLFSALMSGRLKVSHIAGASSFLLEIMPLLFIPAAVGLIPAWGILRDSLWQYALVMFISTFVVMFFAGHVTQFIIRHQKKKQ